MWFKRELYDNQSNVQRYAPEDQDRHQITAPHAPPGVLHHSTLVNGGPGYFFGKIRAVDGKIQKLMRRLKKSKYLLYGLHLAFIACALQWIAIKN